MNNNVIIIGPQGSGKTTKARELAASIGNHVEIVADDVLGRFGPVQLLSGPEAVIVDEVRRDQWPALAARLKGWICAREITVNVKYRPAVRIPTPNFIVVSNDLSDDVVLDSERRFAVIKCGARKSA